MSHNMMADSIACCDTSARCLLQALQLLNTEYAQALRYLQTARSEHLDPGAVLFPVGKDQCVQCYQAMLLLLADMTCLEV